MRRGTAARSPSAGSGGGPARGGGPDTARMLRRWQRHTRHNGWRAGVEETPLQVRLLPLPLSMASRRRMSWVSPSPLHTQRRRRRRSSHPAHVGRNSGQPTGYRRSPDRKYIGSPDPRLSATGGTQTLMEAGSHDASADAGAKPRTPSIPLPDAKPTTTRIRAGRTRPPYGTPDRSFHRVLWGRACLPQLNVIGQ